MKIAVVTGASSGLGREFARQISARYSKFDEIWLIARRTERLEEVADEIKLTSRVISLDLSSKDELMALKELLEENAPDIKLLVNCAGYGKSGSFDELGYDEQLGMIDINCRALTAVTKLCLPYISSNSRIIELASAAAFMPQPDFAVYAATKSYVLSFSKAINKELKPKKITVTAVCPGPVDTEFFDIAGKNVKLLKRMVMAKPENVVEQAIKDAAHGNELSIFGRTMKLAHVAGRFLPHIDLLTVCDFPCHIIRTHIESDDNCIRSRSKCYVGLIDCTNTGMNNLDYNFFIGQLKHALLYSLNRALNVSLYDKTKLLNISCLNLREQIIKRKLTLCVIKKLNSSFTDESIGKCSCFLLRCRRYKYLTCTRNIVKT